MPCAVQDGKLSTPSRRALLPRWFPGSGLTARSSTGGRDSTASEGVVLPFTPLHMTFHHVDYFVDLPPVRTWFLHLHLQSCLLIIHRTNRRVGMHVADAPSPAGSIFLLQNPAPIDSSP